MEARSCLQTHAASFFSQMEFVANVEKLGHWTCESEFSDLLKTRWIWHPWALIPWSNQLEVRGALPPDTGGVFFSSLWSHLPLLCYILPPGLIHQLATSNRLREAFRDNPLSTRHCASLLEYVNATQLLPRRSARVSQLITAQRAKCSTGGTTMAQHGDSALGNRLEVL